MRGTNVGVAMARAKDITANKKQTNPLAPRVPLLRQLSFCFRNVVQIPKPIP